jgi:hypothetical protein
MEYSGSWGKLVHEKKSEVENLVALYLYEGNTFFAVVVIGSTLHYLRRLKGDGEIY